MKNPDFRLSAVATIGALLLAACGGGGSGTTAQQSEAAAPATVATPAAPTNTISDVFDGTTDSNQPITALLQDDGSYFIAYSDAAPPQAVRGAIVGTGTLTGSSFSSSNGLDLNLVGTATQISQEVTLSASYIQQQSFNGSLNYSDKTATFTSAYNDSYATLPSMAALAGVYTGSIATKDLSEDNITLTIAQDGTLTGALTCGCNINAMLAPRKDGKAYFATLSMVGGDHLLSDKSVAGNVYLDTVRKRLYIVGNIVGTSEGVIFVGTKP